MVALEQSKLFCQLTPAELNSLLKAAVEKSFPSGAEIFKEGDTGDGVYLVKSGLVQISGLVAKDTRHIFSRVEPGDVFGEMAVLENKPRSASATAVQDTTVYFIPRDFMLALVEHSPRLAQALLREISARLREFNRQYVREVLQAERLTIVGKFARSIIHDLKNPLNIISLSAEMAVMESATEESRVKANIYIRKQVERITDMINEILEFTQGATSAFSLSPMDYHSYAAFVVKEIASEIGLKSVAIVMENQPPEVKLMLNPRRLRHLFHNLIHNAVEAMPKGGTVTIRFRIASGEIITEIQDTGTGIAPEIADRLFEAFATHGKAHGTGLGLSICKKIVEDHHGRIWAGNADGGGAAFSFALPLPK
jgi:signal transduction histidine kinase